MRFIVTVAMVLCGMACAAEAPLDWTMRDSNGKEVKWFIKYEDSCGGSSEKLPILFTGAEAIMEKFGLSEVKSLPMCGEKVNFFTDKGTINGTTYTMEGAEYVGPWGNRCVYAKSDATPEIEMVLHLWGKFRYWTSTYAVAAKMSRKTYTQEDVGVVEGEKVLDGKKYLAARKAFEAQGMSENDAINAAMADQANYKQTAPWGAGTVTEVVNLPLPEGVTLEKVTSKDGERMFVTKRYTKIRAIVPETRYIQRGMVEDRLSATRESSTSCGDCGSKRVLRSSVTEANLKAAGLMKPEERLEKVLFAEVINKRTETVETGQDVFLQNAPVDVVITSKSVEKTFVTMTTYPLAGK
jgi:hypothetical protein